MRKSGKTSFYELAAQKTRRMAKGTRSGSRGHGFTGRKDLIEEFYKQTTSGAEFGDARKEPDSQILGADIA